MSRTDPFQGPQPASPLLPLESFQAAFRRQKTLGAAVLGGAVAMSAAQAQVAGTEATRTLEGVSVTAPSEATYQMPANASSPKFTAPLLNTPRSVTIITDELMKDRGTTSLQDVLRTTPGITLGSGEGGTPTGDRPFIRGYEASTDVFIDGVRDYARGSHETFNLESVEVIKGPSSAYTGRGGTGGSINLQTKSPKLERFLDVSAGFGNAGQWRTTADGNVTLSDTAAFRLNLMKMGGEVPGRDGVTVDRWGIAPSLAVGLGTPTRLTLSYSHIENNDMPDLGIPFSNSARPWRVTPPDVDRDLFYGRHRTDFRENVFDTATAKIEHDVSEHFKLRNITRYGKTLNHYLMTRPSFDNCTASRTNRPAASCYTEDVFAEYRRDDRARWRSSTSIINQTDLYGTFSTGPVKHSYVAGLEFSKETIYSKSMGGLPGRDHDLLHFPNPDRPYLYNITYGDRTTDGHIKTRSLYVMDTMELTPQWSVNAGVRHDSFRVDDTEDRRKDNFWNWQLGAVYKPAANGSVYLSYATSSNPSGENLGQAGGADGPAGGAAIRDLKPERSRSWELGTKWDVLDQRLSLTAAVFETRKTDARSTDPLTGDVTLGGNNRVRGIELGASGAITSKWNIWTGLSLLDPKVTHYRSGSNVYDGNQMKFIAKRSFNLWTTYAVTPQLTIGGGLTYLGERYADDANRLVLPSYTRWDAMARYQVNNRLSVQFNVNNITDTAMYDASHVGLFANVGHGRSYMLSASYRFD